MAERAEAVELVEAEQPPMRNAHGRFLPGHPGTPGAGRPRGITNADLIRTALEERRNDLVGQVLKNAFSQDGQVSNKALELALSRLAPPPKQDSERVVIPGFKEAATLQEKAETVLAAAAAGDISVEAAEKLLRVLDIYGRAIAVTDHERRLASLEGRRRGAAVEPVEDLVGGAEDPI